MKNLQSLPTRGSLLDVGCGRGAMMEAAEQLGFKPVFGTEIVPELLRQNVTYAAAHALPFADRSFNVVTMWDVLEHLLPGDDELACRELKRVAKKHVLFTINNKPSIHQGVDLHINKRPFEEWEALLADWFIGGNSLDAARSVRRIEPFHLHDSPCWRVDL